LIPINAAKRYGALHGEQAERNTTLRRATLPRPA